MGLLKGKFFKEFFKKFGFQQFHNDLDGFNGPHLVKNVYC